MNRTIIYVTGNKFKISAAQHYLNGKGITILQESADTKEIQSEDIEEVALDKAKKAYEVIKKPLLVNDAGWIILALNGFPGPFMKFMNEWFSSEDFLALMKDKKDKTVILRDVYVYYDGKKSKIFSYDYKGKMLNETKGEGRPSDRVMSLSGNDESIAEEDKRTNETEDYNQFWEDFPTWLNSESNSL